MLVARHLQGWAVKGVYLVYKQSCSNHKLPLLENRPVPGPSPVMAHPHHLVAYVCRRGSSCAGRSASSGLGCKGRLSCVEAVM